MKRNMTDEALVEADRLEEEGRWEEAAVRRLNVDGGGASYAVGTGEVWAEVWAGAHGLRVQMDRYYPTASRGPFWFWSPGGWSSTPCPQSGVRAAAEQCPPEVRRAVEEAVRQVLERRFGGGG